MMGAMSAVSVRHERRKKKSKKERRPKKLLLKPQMNEDGTMSPTTAHTSRGGSRAGSPTHGPQNGVEPELDDLSVHYGDECFYGKVSLLHFVIFFILGGLTILIVGLVQLKKEATLNFFKYKIIICGGALMGCGVLLLIIKCIFFRKPRYYEYEDEDEMMAEKHLANDIEKKHAKSTAEGTNGDSAKAKKHPHLAITITPASDGKSEEIEALTSSDNNGGHRIASAKENGDSSDNRNNIKMHEIKASATEKHNSTVIATSVDSSISTATKHDIVQSINNPSVV